MKMLIIEDDERIARPLKLHLEHEQHSVQLAFDGASGLKLALESQFDFILLDIMLPIMS
jgi:DNA-binding response OmpR family regulator